MVTRFSTTSRHFADEFRQFLASRAQEEQQVTEAVRGIIARVQKEGDAALVALTQQFDRCTITVDAVRVTPQEMANALALATPELMKSLKAAASRIQAYSERQLPKNERYVDESGVTLGWKWSAVDAVGLYVPGGKAAYPSSVLMNAIPARVAGVQRLAMTVPAPEGNLNPAVLAAAHVAGIEEIYRVGGAQAIAALAFGTETIAAVDKIVGPGNAYVTEAKRQVFGHVGIDMIAGPSEVVVMADASNDPDWVAIDLLSQAEHSEDAQAILITDNHAYGARVEKAVEQQLQQLPRAGIAGASWERFGAIVLARDWEEAAEVVNLIAPEHVELFIHEPERIEPLIRHAGAIFLGKYTPEAVGDYIAGPSHVLPTNRAARFASGLSVFDFLKRTSIIGATAESLAKIGLFAEVLAYTEGLQAHARSLFIRKKMNERITTLTLDEGSIGQRSAEVERTKKTVAITDLLHANTFQPLCMKGGPYAVHLSVSEGRLIFDITSETGETAKAVLVVSPLKRIIRDYFLICESYYAALKEAKPHKLEAIDMGRRGVHNEGSEALQALLEGRISVDFNTARRLFTLICVLHMR